MSLLLTVQDYITEVRRLLQDEVQPYRYSDDDLVAFLNQAFLEVRRVRPDAMRRYFYTNPPTYSASSLSQSVDMDMMFRMALVYYMAGRAHLLDEEPVQDTRAAAFLNKFTAQLMVTAS